MARRRLGEKLLESCGWPQPGCPRQRGACDKRDAVTPVYVRTRDSGSGYARREVALHCGRQGEELCRPRSGTRPRERRHDDTCEHRDLRESELTRSPARPGRPRSRRTSSATSPRLSGWRACRRRSTSRACAPTSRPGGSTSPSIAAGSVSEPPRCSAWADYLYPTSDAGAEIRRDKLTPTRPTSLGSSRGLLGVPLIAARLDFAASF